MKEQQKFISRNIQNEIIQIMANQITGDITANIRNNFYSIRCDEYTDISTKEKLYRFAYVGLINFLLRTKNS